MIFSLTILISALQLFLFELITAKQILPIFGGVPAVWNTCMAFYQVLMVLGYLYAHFICKYLKSKQSMILHLVLVFIPMTVLPLNFNSAKAPQSVEITGVPDNIHSI